MFSLRRNKQSLLIRNTKAFRNTILHDPEVNRFPSLHAKDGHGADRIRIPATFFGFGSGFEFSGKTGSSMDGMVYIERKVHVCK